MKIGRIALSLTLAAVLATFLLVSSVQTAHAHHSIAQEFDLNTPSTVKGVVTKVEWRNPHVVFHVDVRNADGRSSNLAVETTAGTGGIERLGLSRDSIKPGDMVGMEVWVSKTNASRAVTWALTLPDGRAVQLPLMWQRTQ